MKYTAEEELILKTLSFYEEMDFAKIVLDLDANELKNFPDLNREKIEAILNKFSKKKIIEITLNNGEKSYKRINPARKKSHLPIILIVAFVFISLVLVYIKLQ